MHNRFFQYFTKDELATLLKRTGFAVVRIEQYLEMVKNPVGRPEVGLILSLSRKS